jgi:hypothetical protein
VTGPTPTALLLSFAWAIPLSDAEYARVFSDGRARGLLTELDGELGDEWSSAEGFLTSHAEQPLRCVLLGTGTGSPLGIGVGGHDLPCRVIVSWHPAYRTMMIVLSTTASEPGRSATAQDVDLAIALLQSMQARPSFHTAAPGERRIRGTYRGEACDSVRAAVDRAFGDLTQGLELTDSLFRKGWCVEFRGHDGLAPHRIVAADPRPFYGLATGDEGWRFVPPEVAEEALGPPWGTRSFVAAYPMATGIVCLNNKGAEYIEYQREIALAHFGRVEPYFALDSEIAGLDHGMLFVLERVLIRMALADQWLRRAQQGAREPTAGARSDSHTRLLRSSLDDILEMLNTVLPPEVDRLERRLVTTMGVERIIQQLDRQAEAMDEQTRYSYESTVSTRVTRLTVVTVVLTVVTIVLGVLQVAASL